MKDYRDKPECIQSLVLEDCRALVSNVKSEPKGEYSECVTGELEELLRLSR